MANSDYLTINGSQVNLTTYDAAITRCTPFIRGGIPELGFERILGKLTTLPDPWSGQSCAWSHGASYPGTTYFSRGRGRLLRPLRSRPRLDPRVPGARSARTGPTACR